MLSLDGTPTPCDTVEPIDRRPSRTGTDSSLNSQLSSLTFGATSNRSRDSSISSTDDLDLDTLMLAAEQTTTENTTDILELTQVLARVQSACRSVAINLVHVQEELKLAVTATTTTTSNSLQQHLTNLADTKTIVAAAVRASQSLTSHHNTIKIKLHQLEQLSMKIQQLKILAATIESNLESLTSTAI